MKSSCCHTASSIICHMLTLWSYVLTSSWYVMLTWWLTNYQYCVFCRHIDYLNGSYLLDSDWSLFGFNMSSNSCKWNFMTCCLLITFNAKKPTTISERRNIKKMMWTPISAGVGLPPLAANKKTNSGSWRTNVSNQNPANSGTWNKKDLNKLYDAHLLYSL